MAADGTGEPSCTAPLSHWRRDHMVTKVVAQNLNSNFEQLIELIPVTALIVVQYAPFHPLSNMEENSNFVL